MKASTRAADIIASFEGFESLPYHDAVGILTIGYGHVIKHGEQFPAEGLTEQGATDLLMADIERFEHCVNRLVTVEMTQEQFDALCSFAFNLGCGALERSTLLKKLNAGDKDGAAAEFLRWNRAGGQVLAGLTRRRKAESELFLT